MSALSCYSALVRRLAASFALLVTSLSFAGRAAAYCRTSTCQPDDDLGVQGAQCEPHKDTDCGTPIAWQRDCIGYTVQKDASREITLEVAQDLIAQAFTTWESADCGGGTPGIHAIYLGTVECNLVEYEKSAGNTNILLFRDDQWYENGHSKIALTSVNFDKASGELWNADIEVNTLDFDFKQGNPAGDKDLLGVLTHEVGHFLGMAHSAEPNACMYESDHPGMDVLIEDDVLGICAAYPPKDIDVNTCNPIPRHGFSQLCAGAQRSEGKCSVEGAPEQTDPAKTPIFPLLAAIGILALRRRRRAPVGG